MCTWFCLYKCCPDIIPVYKYIKSHNKLDLKCLYMLILANKAVSVPEETSCRDSDGSSNYQREIIIIEALVFLSIS